MSNIVYSVLNLEAPSANADATKAVAASLAKLCTIKVLDGYDTSKFNSVDPSALNWTTMAAYQPVDVGVPVSLSALLPPLDVAENTTIKQASNNITIPFGTKLPVTWSFRYADVARNSSPGNVTLRFASPGQGPSDALGSFTILSGSREEPDISFVPWPNTTFSSEGSLLNIVRIFVITLQVAPFWPTNNIGDTKFRQAPIDVATIAFSVDYWGAYFTLNKTFISDGSLLPATQPNSTFNNLFNVKVDGTSATAVGGYVSNPEVGQPTLATVGVLDKAKLAAGRVKEIASGQPNVKIQAAVDMAGVLNNFLKTATGLFGSIVGSNRTSNTVSAGSLKVQKLLSSFLSVPVAVDINGNTVSKVVEPFDVLQAPVFEALPSGGLLGVVPLRGLQTLMSVPVDALTSSIDKSKLTNLAKIEPLANGLGLSIVPVPIIQAYEDQFTPLTPTTMDITLNMTAAIWLPGANQPVNVTFLLGKISVVVPIIRIPQLYACLRHPIPDDTNINTDMLFVVDPVTLQRLGGIDAILDSLTIAGRAMSAINDLFPLEFLIKFKDQTAAGNTLTSWLSLANNISNILNAVALVGRNAIFIAPGPKYGATSYTLKLADIGWYVTNELAPGVSTIYWVGSPNYGRSSVHWNAQILLKEAANDSGDKWYTGKIVAGSYAAFADKWRGYSNIAFTNSSGQAVELNSFDMDDRYQRFVWTYGG